MKIKMMTAVATGAFVLSSGLALAQATPASPRPDTQQPRTTGTQTDQQTPKQHQNAMNEVVLQGCVARDDSATAGGRTGASTGATGATGATAGGAATAAAGGQMFLLKNATKHDASGSSSAQRGTAAQGTQGGQTGASAQGTSSQTGSTSATAARTGSSSAGMGDTDTYRLMATGTSVNLSKHVWHQVEVRGHIMESSMSTRGTATGAAGQTTQSAQAGQTGQTGQAGQVGQTGQAGQADQRAGGTYGAGSSDQHKAVMVSSVRMISKTCGDSR